MSEQSKPLGREGLKWCPGCQTAKPRGEFYRDSGRKDGLEGHCKECRRPGMERRQGEWMAANAERHRERARDYKMHERKGIPATPDQIARIEAGEIHGRKVHGVWMVLG